MKIIIGILLITFVMSCTGPTENVIDEIDVLQSQKTKSSITLINNLDYSILYKALELELSYLADPAVRLEIKDAKQIVQANSTVEINQIEGYEIGDGVALYIYSLPESNSNDSADPGEEMQPKSNLLKSIVLTSEELLKNNYVIKLDKH